MKALVRAIERMTPEQLHNRRLVWAYLYMVAQRQVAKRRLTQTQAAVIIKKLVLEYCS